MIAKDKTGLEIDEHGTTLIVRITGGKHALFSPAARRIEQFIRMLERHEKIHP